MDSGRMLPGFSNWGLSRPMYPGEYVRLDGPRLHHRKPILQPKERRFKETVGCHRAQDGKRL
jgi:hypothetical protein